MVEWVKDVRLRLGRNTFLRLIEGVWNRTIVLVQSFFQPVSTVIYCFAEVGVHCLNNFRTIHLITLYTSCVFAFRWVWIVVCSFHGKGMFCDNPRLREEYRGNLFLWMRHLLPVNYCVLGLSQVTKNMFVCSDGMIFDAIGDESICSLGRTVFASLSTKYYLAAVELLSSNNRSPGLNVYTYPQQAHLLEFLTASIVQSFSG